MLLIYRLVLINSAEPCIQGSVTVRPDLTVVTRVDGREVPSDEYKDLLPAALQTMSQLLHLMARVKVRCEDEQSRPPSLLLKTAVNCLAEHNDRLEDGSDDQHKFSFMLEQLKLTSRILRVLCCSLCFLLDFLCIF